MKSLHIIGWKTYSVAVISILCGWAALTHHSWSDGIKGIIFGLALIAVRDSIGKMLAAADGNRKALNNVRAGIEVLISKQSERR